MKVRIQCTGTRPLLMHNVRLANPLDPHTKRLKALNSKRTKTDDDRLDIARAEFEGSLYFESELGPFMPQQNLFRSIIGGARLSKAGKKIERGVTLLGDYRLPLLYSGPRDIERLWGNGESTYVDMRPVTVQRQRVVRCRPIFPEWAIEAEALIDPKVIEVDEFVRVVQDAGQMEGLGDYRLLYGRFEATLEML